MNPIKSEDKTLKEIKADKEKRRKRKEIRLKEKIKKQRLEEQETHVDIEKSTDANTITQNKKYPTISVAFPGSALENIQSEELQVYLAGQFARAACVFRVDEVIVFDDCAHETNGRESSVQEVDGLINYRHSVVQFGRILQYLECPQYLRKYFFPKHEDLKLTGLINPLDAPHHIRQDDDFPYREGVITDKPVKNGKGSHANVGLLQDVEVDKCLNSGLRCTVKLVPQEDSKKLRGILVPQTMPKQETGRYWGYKVRLANSLSQVLSKSPYKEGYDITIGISDSGTSVDEIEISTFNHLLIVFGGLGGLESALENDEALNIDDPTLLFDHYVNGLPGQGCRTMRTDEAILVTLSALRTKVNCVNSS